MNVVKPEEMKKLDSNYISAGMPNHSLMEMAGIRLYDCIIENIIFNKETINEIIVFAGVGNNGGDALVLARLFMSDYPVTVAIVGNIEKCTPEFEINYNLLIRLGVKIKEINEVAFEEYSEDTLIIDGIFGNGLKNKPLNNYFQRAINQINRMDGVIVSLDIPSGLRGDNGQLINTAIIADYTIAIQYPQTGCLINDGINYCGELYCIDIGIQSFDHKFRHFLIEEEEILLPGIRMKNSHKYDYGNIILIGGSFGMIGAIALASKSAMVTGTGLVTTCVPENVYNIAAQKIIDEVLVKTTENIDFEKKDAVAFGPGLEKEKKYTELLDKIINKKIPAVIDAGGLFHFKKLLEKYQQFGYLLVLTPHLGEFRKLLDLDSDTLSESILDYAIKFARKFQVVLVLKGHYTIITDGNKVFFNNTGNPGMATAGSGDVLSGMIVSLIGQGLDLFEAAKTGVYCHGYAGDMAMAGKKDSIVAGDIIDNISSTFKQLKG
jgi:NAD(P)H-hydrate epimerase